MVPKLGYTLNIIPTDSAAEILDKKATESAVCREGGSRKMEGVPALLEGRLESLRHDVHGAVVGQFQVVDARHHGRQVAVRVVRAVVGLAHYRQWRVQRLETCRQIIKIR